MNSNTPGGDVVENKFASLLWEIGSHYSRLLGFKLYFFFDLVTLRVINLIGCGGILPKLKVKAVRQMVIMMICFLTLQDVNKKRGLV